MIVLVCGGREYEEAQRLYRTLSNVHENYRIDKIVCGGAPGADPIALSWAIKYGVRCDVYPADWHKHGKSAGPIRNKQMLEDAKPDMVIAFPGGKGTANMTSLARKKANVRVWCVEE
jgi:hypothetical protein